MRTPATTMVLHDEVLEILTADTILDTSALAPLGEHGEGDCISHDGCLPIG
jgi:hypothetical protein